MKFKKIIIALSLVCFTNTYAFASMNLKKLGFINKAKIQSYIKSDIFSVAWIFDNKKRYKNTAISVKKDNVKAKFASSQAGLPDVKILDVPFSAQAPRGRWVLPYSEACEETSLIMVKAYLNRATLKTEEVENEIKNLVKWETNKNYQVDIGTKGIADIVKNFYGMDFEIFSGDKVSEKVIKELINNGNPIIVPVAGQKLGNINYVGAGPLYHVLVITGYDDQFFYTHDPGTRNGMNYKYEKSLFLDAIHDWNGNKSTVLTGDKKFIILK